ncbi:MAG: hypothetical protein ACTS3F_14645 [Phycisphaerales bacterium]
MSEQGEYQIGMGETGPPGAGSVPMRPAWVLFLAALVVIALVLMFTGAWLFGVVLLLMAGVAYWFGRRPTDPVFPAVAEAEPSFAWGLDEIPEGPAQRALALRRIRDRKLMRRTWRESMRATKPGDQLLLVLGYVMALGGLGWLVLQVFSRNWTPRLLAFLVMLGCLLLVTGIGWLLHPARSWRATGDGRMREDRLLWFWTPRGLAQTQRWCRWQAAGSFAACSGLVLVVWIAPRLGIGVPSAMGDLANELIGFAALWFLIAIAMLVMPLPASARRQFLVFSRAVLWAPENGVGQDGEMEGREA